MTTVIRKSQDMLSLEDSFADLKNRVDQVAALQRIQKILKRNFDVSFTISIVENTTTKFFGMSIYPDMGPMQAIIKSIIEQRSSNDVVNALWEKSKVWNLEIDSILLYDKSLNANPAEITAVLLHEIGHVVFSNTIPERINKVMRYKLASSSLAVKRLVKWHKAQKLFQIVFIEACSSKNFFSNPMKSELVADKFAVKYGYGKNLEEFLGKLISSQGNSTIDRTTAQLEKDIVATTNWAVNNIAELEFRKTSIRQTLQVELLKNPSDFVRDVVTDIKGAFFGLDEKDLYNDTIREQYLVDEYKSIVKESWAGLFDKYGKFKKISQLDVDIISVESGRIKTDDDKIYVLDLIYDKLSIINTGLDLIKEGKKEKVPQSKDSLTNLKNQLEKIRTSVLDAAVITPEPYKVSVDYPAGYKG